MINQIPFFEKARYLKFFIGSFLYWMLLVSFFDTKDVWGVFIITAILYFINFTVKLCLHFRITYAYNVAYSITLENILLAIVYFSPIVIIFLISYYFRGSIPIALPEVPKLLLAIFMSFWMSWIEPIVSANSFIVQIIDSLHRGEQ